MVDFPRGNAKAADYLDSLGDDCLLSAITALELIAGARNQREVTDLDILISAYEQIPPNEEIARRAYALMMTFARAHSLDRSGPMDSRTSLPRAGASRRI
jgi:predicted nucleic acid-binding protein